MLSATFVASTRSHTREQEPQRILTLEEFMRQPRTDVEIATYHAILAELRRFGWVDDKLSVVGP